MLVRTGWEGAMTRKLSIMIIGLCFAACATQNYGSAIRTSDQMVKEAKTSIREVSVNDVRKMIDNREKITILDVRDKEEFETGYIPGAINLSRGMLEFKISTLVPDKNASIIVYCGVDLRGPLATETLNQMGYKNAVNIIGGLKAWKAAGYPIAKRQ
jgi:rhodanese-related sulfurtransferase